MLAEVFGTQEATQWLQNEKGGSKNGFRTD